MKIKIDAKELIKEQKKTQKRCVELLGKGKYSVAELEKIVDELKNINKSLENICSTVTTITATSCGGSLINLEVPAISQGKLYKENKELELALTMQIDIAKTNKLEFVTDFYFADEQIVNYGRQFNII